MVEVRILSRCDPYDEGMAGAIIEVDKKFFGALPDIHEDSRWYYVRSKRPVSGRMITIRNNEQECLNLTAVLVYGEECLEYEIEENTRK